MKTIFTEQPECAQTTSLIDAHTHWTMKLKEHQNQNPHYFQNLIQGLLSGPVKSFGLFDLSPRALIEEQQCFSSMIKLQALDSGGICLNWGAGLHPYFVAEHENSRLEAELDFLAKNLNHITFVGEIGLDFRSHLVDTSEKRDRQVIYFEQQLQLAFFAHKPVVLHVVKAHSEVLKILKEWSGVSPNVFHKNFKVRGYVHRFQGSKEIVQQYIQMGFMISVSLHSMSLTDLAQDLKLKELLSYIPLEFLLLETDFDDTDSYQGDMQNLKSRLEQVYYSAGKLELLYHKVAEFYGLPLLELIKIISNNWQALIL